MSKGENTVMYGEKQKSFGQTMKQRSQLLKEGMHVYSLCRKQGAGLG